MNNETAPTEKKVRAKRSDAGQPRGPRPEPPTALEVLAAERQKHTERIAGLRAQIECLQADLRDAEGAEEKFFAAVEALLVKPQ